MTYALEWDEQALAAASRFLDDAGGLRSVLDTLDLFADDPWSADATRVGSDSRLRIRIGRYRVMVEIDDAAKAVRVLHVGRLG
ncbi:hypothetical protein GCM10023205_11260 [Yinghuangia aomiensis]|uniref:mRNA interferase RelE/StbE n=1 Tax=Yinghuangia aomiensis TaxID=676205 RepID=A0ABP9H0F2_9ACTN